jgi:hypothetical protein
MAAMGAPHAFMDDVGTWTGGAARSSRWQGDVNARIVPQLGDTPVLLSAPTGAGKSRELPPLLLERFGAVILIVPRRDLCISNPRYHWVRKGVPARWGVVNVVTAGHYAKKVWHDGVLGDFARVVTLVDEAHTLQSEYVETMAALVGKPNLILMTATPSATPALRLFPAASHVKINLPRTFSITKHERAASDWVALATQQHGSGGRTLIICATKTDARRRAGNLRARGYNVCEYFSGYTDAGSEYIVASQVADSGANIRGVTCVIDTARLLVKHRGRLINVPVSTEVSEQRAGRTGRFCNGTYYRLGEASHFQPEVYPSADAFFENAALWSRVFPIKCVFTPWTQGGLMYIWHADAVKALGLKPSETRIILRFALRHDTPSDATEACAILRDDAEAHGDLFGRNERLRSRLASDPNLLMRLLATDPFKVCHRGKRLRVNWLRVMDGEVSTEANRMKPSYCADPVGLMPSVAETVEAEACLPASARWAPMPRAVSARELVKLWLREWGEVKDARVRLVLRRIPTRPATGDASDIAGIRAAVTSLSQEMLCSVYVRFSPGTAAIKLNTSAPMSGKTALLDFSPDEHRLAYWDTAAGVIHIRPSLPAAGAMPGLFSGPARGTSDSDGVIFKLPKLWRLTEPEHAWQLCPYETGHSHCGVGCIEWGLGVRLDAPATGFDTIEDLWSRWMPKDASTSLVGIDVGENTSISTIGRSDDTHAIALSNHGDHWQLLGVPDYDGAVAPYPLQRSPDGCLPVMQCTVSGPDELAPDWRLLYLGSDKTPTRSEPWASWESVVARLDEHFGDSYAPHAPTSLPTVADEDRRVHKLAGWASFHRTQVVVKYQDLCWFRLLPSWDAACHPRAKLGRAIWLELGAHGARHYWAESLPARGSVCWSDVTSSIEQTVDRDFCSDNLLKPFVMDSAAATRLLDTYPAALTPENFRMTTRALHAFDVSVTSTGRSVLAREAPMPLALTLHSETPTWTWQHVRSLVRGLTSVERDQFEVALLALCDVFYDGEKRSLAKSYVYRTAR